VTSVLFVCTANICRSAYAEMVATYRAPGLSVGSAGTHGVPDLPLSPEMAAELDRRGIPHEGFRSRPLTRELIDDADLVLTAEAAHRAFVLQERPVAVRRTFSLGQFASALDDVPDGVAGADLLKEVRRARATARRDEDVADPYGRGPEAAERAAEHLDRLLDRVLDRLVSAE